MSITLFFDNFDAMKNAAVKIDCGIDDKKMIWITIFGSMLFSTNQNMRIFWITRQILKKHTELASKKGEQGFVESCQQIGVDFAEIAYQLGGPKLLYDAIFSQQLNVPGVAEEERIKNGFEAAKVFRLALERGRDFADAAAHLHTEMEKEANANKAALIPRSPESIVKNLKKHFLPTIHFWAAYLFFSENDGIHLNADSIDEMFFCSFLRKEGKQDGLGGFLRLANKYLEAGLNQHPKRPGPKGPLLDITKMFVTPNAHWLYTQ